MWEVHTGLLTLVTPKEARIAGGGYGEWRDINIFFIFVWIVSLLIMGMYYTFII